MTNVMLLHPNDRIIYRPNSEATVIRLADRRRPRVHPAIAFGIRATLALFVGIALSVMAWKVGLGLFAMGFVAAIGG